jgi:hypothetical protein
MDTELQFVTYEQAKKLKALGFDYECSYFFRTSGELDIEANLWYHSEFGYDSPAPTVALALKWIRDEKKLFGYVYNTMFNKFLFHFYDHKDHSKYDFNTYESAESALLDELLNILEKEEQQ